MSKNAVSFYIPARNCEKTLERAIKSVLSQTYPIHEFMIVCDARSQDKTLEIAQKYKDRIHIIKQKHGGIGLARNKAFQSARGEFLAFCDADNVLAKDFLKNIMTHFKRDESIALVGGKVNEVVRSVYDEWRELHIPHNWGDVSFYNPYMLVSTGCAKVNALQKVGGYDEQFLRCYEDSDICFRLKNSGYNLFYAADAAAEHVRRDDLYSLLDTYWGFKTFKGKPMNTFAELLYKCEESIHYSITTMNKSFALKKINLAYISFLIPFHHVLRNIEYLLLQKNADTEVIRKHILRVFLLYGTLLEEVPRDLKRKALKDLHGFFKQYGEFSSASRDLNPTFLRFLNEAKEKLHEFLKCILAEAKLVFSGRKNRFAVSRARGCVPIKSQRLISKNSEISEYINGKKKNASAIVFHGAEHKNCFSVLKRLHRFVKEILFVYEYPREVCLNSETVYPRDMAQWTAQNDFHIQKFALYTEGFFVHIKK